MNHIRLLINEAALFKKSFIFYVKIRRFTKISAFQTNESSSNFLSFLLHKLVVKFFFSNGNSHFSVKTQGFPLIFNVNCTFN